MPDVRRAGRNQGNDPGRTIELVAAAGLPDGQEVSVTVQPLASPEERLRRSFGSWADAGEELDEFLDRIRHDRKVDRPEIAD